MALLQEIKKETSARTDRLLKLEEGNEASSSRISDERNATMTDRIRIKSAINTDGTGTESTRNVDGTGTESASNPDGIDTESASNTNSDNESSDENRERKNMKMSNDPQLKEKQYIFLKKHFDELRTRKIIPNWYKRYDELTTLKPLKFEDLPCECHLENECRISENTNEEKELLARQETPTAQSDVSTKSQNQPLAEHNNTCNVNRLNLYFRAIAEYFTEEDSHSDLFLLDPNPSVDYKQKAMREIRKITVLKLRYGLEATLEEWEDCMTDKDVEKWEKRNNTREYLHFILNNMLESLIGSNESITESEESPDDDADDSALSPSRRNAHIDPDKPEYQKLKKLHEELEVKLKNSHERSKRLIQEAVIAGYYPQVQTTMRKIRATINEFLALSPETSSDESERETEQETNQIRGAEKNESE